MKQGMKQGTRQSGFQGALADHGGATPFMRE
jgi:hypothetical protein